MARRGRGRYVVPGANLDPFYNQVARQHGFAGRANDLKYYLAQRMNIPLEPGYNGHLLSKDAGRIGGNIGGPMVREMIRYAETRLSGTTGTRQTTTRG